MVPKETLLLLLFAIWVQFFLFLFSLSFARKLVVGEMEKRIVAMKVQLLVAICGLAIPCCLGGMDLQGHMERLGMQRKSEGHIEVLNGLPNPIEFFEKYIKPGKPVVFKGAAKEMPAFKKWNDEYLR